MMMKRRVLLVGLVFCLLCSAVYASDSGTAGANMPHRMMLLVIQFGLILFAAKMGNILFTKIKLSGILGELAAGMLIGPYCLGGIGLPGFG